ncbi:MAG: hemerythrin domain-containing protein [Polyangiaceae bacterium]
MSETNGDRRQLTLDDNEQEIRAAVEALGAGEGLIIAGEDPRAIVDELEEEEAGRFEWSLLEDSSARTRLEVRRRKSEGPRSVTKFLQADHDRLDAILVLVQRLAEEGSFPEAQASFGEFACGLDWHINVEEQLVFPFFEAKTGMTRGPTTVMRAEHKEIREGIQGVSAALSACEAVPSHDAISKLNVILTAHNMKEEKMLYPMTDRAIDTFEAQERLVRRIAKF